MKKKIISVFLIVGVMIFSGCANKTTQPTGDVQETNAAEDEDNTLETSEASEEEAYEETLSDAKKYVSERIKNDMGNEDVTSDTGYEVEYSFTATSDTTGIFVETDYYNNGAKYTSEYEGTYEMEGDCIKFHYGTDGDEYRIYLDGDKVKNVEYFFKGSEDEVLTGTYAGTSPEYGDLTLEARDDRTATINCSNGTVMEGSISYYEDKYEFMCSLDDETYIDWYIYPDGDTFTYETYRRATFKECSGEYTMTGDLGDLVLYVDEEGFGDIDATVDGAIRHFRGSIYTDNDNKKIIGGYFENVDGYALSLDIEVLQDGTWNYSGRIEIPLAAG